jgi:DNA-binding transcriptional LysR family regulator
MELQKMKYFLALCQVGSFTRAAAICGTSQPAFSIAIGHELGRPLFDRGPPVRLSPLGEAVKPHFEAILRETDKIHQLSSEGITHSGNDQGREADPSGAYTYARFSTSDDRLQGVTKCPGETKCEP